MQDHAHVLFNQFKKITSSFKPHAFFDFFGACIRHVDGNNPFGMSTVVLACWGVISPYISIQQKTANRYHQSVADSSMKKMVGKKLLELRKHVGNHHLKNMRFWGLPTCKWNMHSVAYFSSLLGALRNLLTTSYTEMLNMAQQTQGWNLLIRGPRPLRSLHIPNLESGNRNSNGAPRLLPNLNPSASEMTSTKTPQHKGSVQNPVSSLDASCFIGS